MTWEELLSFKNYVYYAKCCGGWHKYTTKDNLTIVSNVIVPINEFKVLRIRADRVKYYRGSRMQYSRLPELESILNELSMK